MTKALALRVQRSALPSFGQLPVPGFLETILHCACCTRNLPLWIELPYWVAWGLTTCRILFVKEKKTLHNQKWDDTIGVEGKEGMNARKAFYSIFNKDGRGTFFKSGEERTASIWTLSVPGFLQIILLWRCNANLSCLRGTLMHSLCQIKENTPQSSWVRWYINCCCKSNQCWSQGSNASKQGIPFHPIWCAPNLATSCRPQAQVIGTKGSLALQVSLLCKPRRISSKILLPDLRVHTVVVREISVEGKQEIPSHSIWCAPKLATSRSPQIRVICTKGTLALQASLLWKPRSVNSKILLPHLRVRKARSGSPRNVFQWLSTWEGRSEWSFGSVTIILPNLLLLPFLL